MRQTHLYHSLISNLFFLMVICKKKLWFLHNLFMWPQVTFWGVTYTKWHSPSLDYCSEPHRQLELCNKSQQIAWGVLNPMVCEFTYLGQSLTFQVRVRSEVPFPGAIVFRQQLLHYLTLVRTWGRGCYLPRWFLLARPHTIWDKELLSGIAAQCTIGQAVPEIQKRGEHVQRYPTHDLWNASC